MLKYIVQRLLFLVPIIVLSTMFAFLFLNMSAISPAEIMVRSQMIGDNPTPEQMQAFHRRHGTDKPVVQQYWNWLSNAIRGDMGISWKQEERITPQYMQKLGATVQLFLAGQLVLMLIAIPLGVLAAMKPNSLADHLCSLLSSLSIALPSFWIAMLLLYIFALSLNLLPSFGYRSPVNIILPALTLGISGCGGLMKITRTSVLEVKDMNYVRTAVSKGLSKRRVLTRHILKNSFIPILTAIGMSMTHMLSGTVIIENIFAWPGIGRYFITAANTRDLPIVMGYIFYTAVFLVVINLIIDFIYMFLDPKINYRKKEQ